MSGLLIQRFVVVTADDPLYDACQDLVEERRQRKERLIKRWAEWRQVDRENLLLAGFEPVENEENYIWRRSRY